MTPYSLMHEEPPAPPVAEEPGDNDEELDPGEEIAALVIYLLALLGLTGAFFVAAVAIVQLYRCVLSLIGGVG